MKLRKPFGKNIPSKMLLVIDPNVVISAVLGKGNSSMVFSLNNVAKKFDFVAPELFVMELGKHTDKIANKTKFSFDEAKEVLEFITKQITLIPESQYKDKIEEAKELLKGHGKDAPYLALALKFNCKIFSGDKKLKELVPNIVENPKELLEDFGL